MSIAIIATLLWAVWMMIDFIAIRAITAITGRCPTGWTRRLVGLTALILAFSILFRLEEPEQAQE